MTLHAFPKRVILRSMLGPAHGSGEASVRCMVQEIACEESSLLILRIAIKDTKDRDIGQGNFDLEQVNRPDTANKII